MRGRCDHPLWDAQSGANVQTIAAQGTVYSVAWSSDGTHLASGYFDGQIQIWELQATQPATCVQTLSGHTHWVVGLAFAPDGTKLASASWDRTVRLWDMATGACTQILQDPDYSDTVFYSVAWSPDGQRLASGSYQHGVQVWEMTARSRLWVGRAHLTFVGA